MSRWKWLLIPMVMLLVSIFAISIYSAEGDLPKKEGEGGIAFVSVESKSLGNSGGKNESYASSQ